MAWPLAPAGRHWRRRWAWPGGQPWRPGGHPAQAGPAPGVRTAPSGPSHASFILTRSPPVNRAPAAVARMGQATRSATLGNAAGERQTMPMGHRVRFLALAAVCIFLTSLALAACGSATSARSVSPGFTGYDWQVVAISHNGKVTSIPARLQVALRFSPGGQLGADANVNFPNSPSRTTTNRC